MLGDPRGYALLGRRMLYGVREGEAASCGEGEGERWKGESGAVPPPRGVRERLNLQWSLQPLLKASPITEKKRLPLL